MLLTSSGHRVDLVRIHQDGRVKPMRPAQRATVRRSGKFPDEFSSTGTSAVSMPMPSCLRRSRRVFSICRICPWTSRKHFMWRHKRIAPAFLHGGRTMRWHRQSISSTFYRGIRWGRFSGRSADARARRQIQGCAEFENAGMFNLGDNFARRIAAWTLLAVPRRHPRKPLGRMGCNPGTVFHRGSRPNTQMCLRQEHGCTRV
jgi:hypothetical protein